MKEHEVVVFREKYYWLITAREELSGKHEAQVDTSVITVPYITRCVIQEAIENILLL